MRFWLAFTLGTASAVAVTFMLMAVNGTTVPPVRDWRGVASYPTGSALTYFGLLWAIYAFWIAATARWRRRG